MATTDSNGIVVYQETDPFSPLSTLLNMGMSSVSAAIASFGVPRDNDLGPVVPHGGFTTSAAWVIRVGHRACLQGAVVSTGAMTITTAFTEVAVIPGGPGRRPGINHYFTVGIFGGGTAQMQVDTAGGISIRALTGTIELVNGTSIYLDGIEYQSAT